MSDEPQDVSPTWEREEAARNVLKRAVLISGQSKAVGSFAVDMHALVVALLEYVEGAYQRRETPEDIARAEALEATCEAKPRRELSQADAIALVLNKTPTEMLNEAALALGWRTDFACGDSPITWSSVLDEIRKLKGIPAQNQDVRELIARAETYDYKPHLLYSHIAVMAQRCGSPTARAKMLDRYERPVDGELIDARAEREAASAVANEALEAWEGWCLAVDPGMKPGGLAREDLTRIAVLRKRVTS